MNYYKVNVIVRGWDVILDNFKNLNICVIIIYKVECDYNCFLDLFFYCI